MGPKKHEISEKRKRNLATYPLSVMTNSMQQSPYWEAGSRLAGHEILIVLWNR
jgi:hypothetical protein